MTNQIVRIRTRTLESTNLNKVLMRHPCTKCYFLLDFVAKCYHGNLINKLKRTNLKWQSSCIAWINHKGCRNNQCVSCTFIIPVMYLWCINTLPAPLKVKSYQLQNNWPPHLTCAVFAWKMCWYYKSHEKREYVRKQEGVIVKECEHQWCMMLSITDGF